MASGVADLSAGLTIDGKPCELGPEFSLHFAVSGPNGELEPVLYRNGKRVVAAWSLELSIESSADPFGGNANTG